MSDLAHPKPEKRGPKPKGPLKRGPSPKRTKGPRKQRKSSLAALKRQLWSLFSAYVKERDGNKCVSCGREGLEGSNWHAGHLWPQNGPQLIRWHPKNVHSQCGFRCNLSLRGNVANYASRFLDLYGVEEFKRMSALAAIPKQWKAYELEELIAAAGRSWSEYEALYEERHCLPALGR